MRIHFHFDQLILRLIFIMVGGAVLATATQAWINYLLDGPYDHEALGLLPIAVALLGLTLSIAREGFGREAWNDDFIVMSICSEIHEHLMQIS